ncbi:hypothetical protein GCM10011571_00370 [Marinithermofilum abyssi]|uniref:Uncharacterized protein n=1 Tax=Marinithermofilum abyssi TaxID=1571185 RepID=A0A8J2VDW2_9BACL|nr:hypothetical protein GCM10011571_00370 [Marinithermofilum abyssi]
MVTGGKHMKRFIGENIYFILLVLLGFLLLLMAAGRYLLM